MPGKTPVPKREGPPAATYEIPRDRVIEFLEELCGKIHKSNDVYGSWGGIRVSMESGKSADFDIVRGCRSYQNNMIGTLSGRTIEVWTEGVVEAGLAAVVYARLCLNGEGTAKFHVDTKKGFTRNGFREMLGNPDVAHDTAEKYALVHAHAD